MKPALIPSRRSLNCIEFDHQTYPYFFKPWHYHPELELTLIKESFGLRLVGDSMESFSENDLVLVGSNLPHVWKNDESYFQKDGSKKARAIVVKFMPAFVGQEFLMLNEMKLIRQLIYEKAAFGLKIKGNLKQRVADMLDDMLEMDETEHVLQLLKIMHQIAVSDEYERLASLAYRKPTPLDKEEDDLRINVVLDYLLNNYQNRITLDKVAALIYMNKNAFCRFFKKSTGKTMLRFLYEIRIGMACRKLQKTEESLERISDLAGFNNISNFNRVFKLITHKTPSEYRKQFRELGAGI